MRRIMIVVLLVTVLLLTIACQKHEKITQLKQLQFAEIAVPSGTMADQLVLTTLPNAKMKYFNNVMDACLAVKTGKVAAAAYDEPILKNIAAKTPGLKVLDELITHDDYGFAVNFDNPDLKNTIDLVVDSLKKSGKYEEMYQRWFPKQGNPAKMPVFENNGTAGELLYGTAAVTEPFSFYDENQQIVGFDIELAYYVAQRLNKKLVITNMEFGALINALTAKKVDMIGACLTISEERAKKVLFSNPYYSGGIAAIVKE